MPGVVDMNLGIAGFPVVVEVCGGRASPVVRLARRADSADVVLVLSDVGSSGSGGFLS